MTPAISYRHHEHFSWRSDWQNWRRVWCHLWGHRDERPKDATLSYWAKRNKGDWNPESRSVQVQYCYFCRTTTKFDVAISADLPESSVSQVQILEAP